MHKRHTEYVGAALFIKPKAKSNPLATGRQADKMVLRTKARIPTSSEWLTVEGDSVQNAAMCDGHRLII